MLTRIPFSYWGSFPVGITSDRDLRRQMILCDTIYDVAYAEFLAPYLALRERYVADLRRAYPQLRSYIPSFAESREAYRTQKRSQALAEATGNDAGRGRRPTLTDAARAGTAAIGAGTRRTGATAPPPACALVA